MSIKVAVEGSTVTEVVLNLKALAHVMETGNQSGITLEGVKEKRGTKGKNTKAAEELEEVEETEEEETTEDGFDEEETEEEESDVISEAEVEKLKVALKAYSAKNGKDKAVKMLHKYAKKSTEVKKADLPKLIKALKV